METARESSVEIAIEPWRLKMTSKEHVFLAGGGLSCYLNPFLFWGESHLLFILCLKRTYMCQPS